MTDPIAYTSTIPGDERTKPVPVYALNQVQKDLRERHLRLLTLISVGIQAARDLEELQNGCRHTVFTDTPGWIYDYRVCYLCGKAMGEV